MNDRYLFRGKRADNGEWETGFLVVERSDTSEERFYITDKMTGYHTPSYPRNSRTMHRTKIWRWQIIV